MLIDFEKLYNDYSMKIYGVLHVGAHLAEEAGEYAKVGVDNVWWVEANPAVVPKIQRKLRTYRHTQRLIQALVTDEDGPERQFNVTNYDGMSSSVFDFGTHTQDSPDTVFERTEYIPTRSIDSLVEEYDIKANMLCLDIQGAEMLALRGARKSLPNLDYIYTEVSTGYVYQGGALMKEIDSFLKPEFKRVVTNLGMHRGKHGDAFYLRVKPHVV